MAGGNHPSISKRQKELRRAEKRAKKEERKKVRDAEKTSKPTGEGEEDPDIAGIVPGPQPQQLD
jgi:hypothetical protein